MEKLFIGAMHDMPDPFDSHAPCSHCGVYNDTADRVCARCGQLMPAEAARWHGPPPGSQTVRGRRFLKWAPLAGAVMGLSIGLRIALFDQGPAPPGAPFALEKFQIFFGTTIGLLGGCLIWLMASEYFGDKRTQHHPNRVKRVVFAFIFAWVPYVGLLLALWAKRGNRLPGKARNAADLVLLLSATVAVVVTLTIVIVNAFPRVPVQGN